MATVTACRPTTSPTMRISGATTTATALAITWAFSTAMIVPTPPATPPLDGKGALIATATDAQTSLTCSPKTTPSGTTKTATATATTKRAIQRTTARRPPEPPVVTGVVAPTPTVTGSATKTTPIRATPRSGRTPTRTATATTRWAWVGTAAR